MERVYIKYLLLIAIIIVSIICSIYFFNFFQKSATAVGTVNPSDYDLDGDGFIEKSEVIYAINQYNFGNITKAQLVDIIKLYFGV